MSLIRGSFNFNHRNSSTSIANGFLPEKEWSKSDYSIASETWKILEYFDVTYNLIVASAHRTPDTVSRIAIEASSVGTKVIIACAGMAAHLAGAIASRTILPVIGVPMPSSTFANGMDALLSTVQMPGGVPVATVSVGKAGAANAAILAVEILALNNIELANKLLKYREDMAKEIREINL